MVENGREGEVGAKNILPLSVTCSSPYGDYRFDKQHLPAIFDRSAVNGVSVKSCFPDFGRK